MDTINNTPAIDPDEFAAAEKDAESGAGSYTHIFKKPFIYMGKTYEELRFDWESLSGHDGLEIEAELQALGKPVVAPEFAGVYHIRMAAKACTEKIGSDAFELMPLSDCNKIRRAARSFLLV